MAIKYYACKSLSGNTVSDGIALRGAKLLVRTDSEGGDILAVSTIELDSVKVAAVGRHKETGRIILKPGEGEKTDQSRELVLVKEYSPGVGGKRRPSFYIDWKSCEEIEVLKKASRTRHSGAEYYSLVFAPVGWAVNIASQFIDVKDYGDPDQPPEECIIIANRLKESGPVPELDAIKAITDEKDFEALAKSVRESIDRNEPENGLDRLHTFLVKYFRVKCQSYGLQIDKKKPLHSLVGEYIKVIKKEGLIESEMTKRILKSSISVMEAFSHVLNNQSFAHDNHVLNYNESP